MAEQKILFVIFCIPKKPGSKQKRFLCFNQAYSETQAVLAASRAHKIPVEKLLAELATEEILDKYGNRKTKKKILWRVFDGEVPLGKPTSAETMFEARRNVWFGIVKPDKKLALGEHPTPEEKAWLKTLTAVPIYGQANPWRSRKRKKISKAQGNLFTI